MRKLLNTLFVNSEDLYLSLDNENVAAWKGNEILQRIPLMNLENILYFGYKGASPALLGACVKRHIGFCFLTPQGKFLARAQGLTAGNVLLRKILNSRTVLMRFLRDHPLSVDATSFQAVIQDLQDSAREAAKADSLDHLRGIEGNAAVSYFSLFDALILNDKKHFYFHGRNKRPPLDRVNALLSFAYTLLAHDCASAIEAAGMDSYIGILHRDRPGRQSLALDLMEELRSVYADRFVLSLVNNRVLPAKCFQLMEDGAVLLNAEGRKTFLSKWQERKKETLTHPFLGEKIYWGLIPYVQALLLARYIRGDLDGYPPFIWK